MFRLLVRIFIKDKENTGNPDVRAAYAVLAGVVGVALNSVLFSLKLFFGITTGSIAVLSDGFNNLSDAGSSIISIVAARFSRKAPDRGHPFGHGRIEYVSSLIISFFIILVGFELLKSSVEKIFRPVPLESSHMALAALAVSIAVKLWMAVFNNKTGKTINSPVVKAAAADSIADSIATAAVAAGMVISMVWDLQIDGFIGVGVSLFILRSGLMLARETVGTLLGRPPSKELAARIVEMITSADGILGAHDLIVHDYGPGRVIASCHAEVPVDVDIVKAHETIDALELAIAKELDLIIVIHMDPVSYGSAEVDAARELAQSVVRQINPGFSLHDFRITEGEKHKNLIFDLVVPNEISEQERRELPTTVRKLIAERNEEYGCVITVESGFCG